MAIHFVLMCGWLKSTSLLWHHARTGCDGVGDSFYFLGVVAPTLLAGWIAALCGLVFVAARSSDLLRRQRLNGWTLVVFAWVVAPVAGFTLSHVDIARFCSGISDAG
jgi:hypothetical protein